MITVFTVVFNNYGRFIPKWIEYIEKQTVKPEIMIILGKKHGANLKWLKDHNIKYTYVNSENMGKLRNTAIEQIKTKWWLYFSVDDELLPHACEEILLSNADAVSLKFRVNNMDGSIQDRLSPMFNEIKDIMNWNENSFGGYVALRHKIKYREDIEVPNMLLYMELFKQGLITERSRTTCAICHRWEKSHGMRNIGTNLRFDMRSIIQEEVNNILDEKQEKFDITIYTTVYNGYDRFIPQWVENIRKQTIRPARIVISVGKNTKKLPQYTDVEYVKCNSDIMGIVRNNALKTIDTEWLLYFSIDDELLPNAIEEIRKKQEYDIVTLRYIDRSVRGVDTIRESAFMQLHEIPKWRETKIPGYIAVKRMIKDKFTLYEDIDIPNYPYLFELASLSPKATITDEITAIYHRRDDSHGGTAKKNNQFIQYAKIIDIYASKYHSMGTVRCMVKERYNDGLLGYKPLKKDIIEMSYYRAIELQNKGLIEIIGGTNANS